MYSKIQANGSVIVRSIEKKPLNSESHLYRVYLVIMFDGHLNNIKGLILFIIVAITFFSGNLFLSD